MSQQPPRTIHQAVANLAYPVFLAGLTAYCGFLASAEFKNEVQQGGYFG